MDNKKRLLSKIKKLLALSRSPNPNEAATALRQAQRLMQEYNINQVEVEIAEVQSKQKFAQKSPRYIHILMGLIEKAFGVRSYLATGFKAQATFFGSNERPEVASYCFDVLYRQLMKARQDFNAMQNKRLKRSTIINRADAFCEGWVLGVYENVKRFALNLSEQEKTMLQQYEQKLSLCESNVRDAGNTREKNGDLAKWLGYEQGKQVELHHGVKGSEKAKLSYKEEIM